MVFSPFFFDYKIAGKGAETAGCYFEPCGVREPVTRTFGTTVVKDDALLYFNALVKVNPTLPNPGQGGD
jgi:hypothetical protein